jgi:hypothetical protein
MAMRTASLEKGQVRAVENTEVSVAEQAVGASMVASGIGSLVLGIAVVLAEVSPGAKAFLTWSKGVGPLSGKSSVAVIAFLVSWAILHYAFQRRAISLTTSFIITVVLLVLGLLLTFPPVFMSFGG